MWETIKKILQKQNGTCIIIEDGKPAYVVMGFGDFQRYLEAKEEAVPEDKKIVDISEQELLNKINDEITTWQAVQAEQQAAENLAEAAEPEVKIEDLPI